jgi:hypothetical protein
MADLQFPTAGPNSQLPTAIPTYLLTEIPNHPLPCLPRPISGIDTAKRRAPLCNSAAPVLLGQISRARLHRQARRRRSPAALEPESVMRVVAAPQLLVDATPATILGNGRPEAAT